MSETYDAALRRGAARLAEAGIDSAMGDARALLAWAVDVSTTQLTGRLRDPAPEHSLLKFNAALNQRAGRSPVSHITGGRLFWGRWFEVTPDVLDPRPETEILIARALAAPSPGKVLDLGVGSACILGTVLAERPDAQGLGVDASAKALTIARRNLDLLGVSERSNLVVGDWLEGVSGHFDLVLCNPPYISETEMPGLSPEGFRHEPHMALTPGGDGLAPYRIIAPKLRGVLSATGAAMFEIGPTQAAAVTAIFARAGWAAPEILCDFDGRDRCLVFANHA